MEALKNWLTKLFAEDNGSDVCIAKVLAVASFLSYVGYSGVGLHKGQFSMTDFATGLMTTLLGAAAVITGKNFSTHRDGDR